MKQKHNNPTNQPITDELRRTLERRVRNWKVDHPVEQEVVVPQIHHPDDVIAFDFVSLNELKITLAGVAFEHMLFQAVLTYSNWVHVHVCHSESCEALWVSTYSPKYIGGTHLLHFAVLRTRGGCIDRPQFPSEGGAFEDIILTARNG